MTSKIAELGEYVDIVMGQAPPGSSCNKEGRGTPFVKAGEFSATGPVIREWTTQPLKMARQNDVLLCVVGATAGKVNPGTNCAIGRSVAAIRPADDKLDSTYLRRFLELNVQKLRAKSQGLAQGVITREMIATLEIPLPPLDEQKRVAAILDKADALRAKRRQAIALLDSLTQSIFLEMFGDPVSNPKGLLKKPLGELIKVSSGNGLTAAQMDADGLYSVYGGNGVNGQHSTFMFEEPQIAIGRVGVYCGAIHVTEPKSWITDNALYVSKNFAGLRLKYLAEALRMADLNQYAGRAAQPLISGSRIYPVEILVPPDDQQLAFEKILLAAATSRGKIYESHHQIETAFTSLQHLAFTGQL